VTRLPASSPVRRDSPGLNPVFQLRFARGARAVDAAEDLSVGFNAMPDNPAVAVRANRSQRVDRALEAVERVALSTNHYFKRFVIFVFANFACSHNINLSRAVSFAAVFI
jgi:hypothetical protein